MKKIYQIYNQIERMILGLILIVLIVMGFVSVICRFVLQVPLAWAEEFMLFCMVWIAYLGYVVTSGYIAHKAVSLGGGYPYWIASISIPVGMILMTIRIILAMMDTLRGKNDERSIEEIIKEETNT